MVQGGGIGRDRQAFAKQRRRFGKVFLIERANAPRLVGLRAFQQLVELHHQRIGRQDLVILALPQMGLGFFTSPNPRYAIASG